MSQPGRYKMGTMSSRLGLDAGLLRAWERRYDLLRPERTAGGQRLYSDDDLRLLRQVKVRLTAGASIGELAAEGRDALLAAASTAAAAPPVPTTSTGLDFWRAGLVEAAGALDTAALDALLDEAFAALGPAAAIYRLVHPAAHLVGERWDSSQLSVVSEHLYSERVSLRLHRLLAAAEVPAGAAAPRAVVGCLPGEQHTLGGLVQAWELSRRGFAVTWLGAAVPLADLHHALQLLHPQVVLLSVSLRATFDGVRGELADLVTGHPEIRWRVGGHGVPGNDGVIPTAPEPVVGDAALPLRALIETILGIPREMI